VGANRVKRALPTRNLKQVDPFLFIDHLTPTEVEPGAAIRIPPHPHAGFEVVTYLLEGEFFHRDSQGHNQVARAGDINWMTSGRGIIHSEGPTDNFLQTGGSIQLLQLWINLPARDKAVLPSFSHYASQVLPVIESSGAWIKVLIGQFGGASSPVVTTTPIFCYHLKLQAGQRMQIPVAVDHNAALYVMQGKIRILHEELQSGQLAESMLDGDQLVFSALQDAELLVFGGLPIAEKVVSYGPFVMNSVEGIEQAMSDYESGKMGRLTY
jgi:redox-sensitive bicupin YhaK (pirin superfamily)